MTTSPTIQIAGLTPAASPLARRVVPVVCALGALAAAVAGLAGNRQAAVLGALGVAVVVAGWVSMQRTQWTVGDSFVAHRGLFGATRLDVTSVRAVMVPTDEVRQGDLLFLGPGLRAVALPAEHLRTNATLAAAVARLLDLAQANGARITHDAWLLVGRPGSATVASTGSGTDVVVGRPDITGHGERRRSLSAA